MSLHTITTQIEGVRTQIRRILGVNNVPTTLPFSQFATRMAQITGLDGIMSSSGYPQGFADALCDILLEQNNALDGISAYTHDLFYDNERSGIVYAPELPVIAGSCTNIFRNCTNLLAISPNIDWSHATSLSRAFENSGIIPSPITLDVAACTTLFAMGGNFTEIHLRNSNNVTSYSQFNNANLYVRKITGVNVSNATNIGAFAHINSPLTTIEFEGLAINDDGTATWDDGVVNYIRNSAITWNSGQNNLFTSFLTHLSAASMLAFCYLAYDWVQNPQGLTAGANDAYRQFDFTDLQKAAIAAAFPNIDVRQLMEDKGWTY